MDQGKEIFQGVNSAAAVAIGTDRLSAVDFSGTILVDDVSDDDWVGAVFSFQDTQNFYVMHASKDQSNQGPWKIVRVKSNDTTSLASGML